MTHSEMLSRVVTRFAALDWAKGARYIEGPSWGQPMYGGGGVYALVAFPPGTIKDRELIRKLADDFIAKAKPLVHQHIKQMNGATSYNRADYALLFGIPSKATSGYTMAFWFKPELEAAGLRVQRRVKL